MASQFYRDALACLRRMGFVRYNKSRSGSVYYRHEQTGVAVRVADHEVPQTDERIHDGSRWSNGWNVLIGEECDKLDAARELVHVRQDVRRKLRLAAQK
jgi:hypothetical protein